MDLTYFQHAVLFLCLTQHASVVSGARTVAHNKAKLGVANSWHLHGLAADLVPDDPARKPFIITGAAKLGLQAFDEGDHVHIEPPGPPPPLPT